MTAVVQQERGVASRGARQGKYGHGILGQSLAYVRCAMRIKLNTVQTCQYCRLCAICEQARGVSSACASQTNDCTGLINGSVADIEKQSPTEMQSRIGKRT